MKRLLNISVVCLMMLLFIPQLMPIHSPNTGQTKCYQAVSPYAEIDCAGTGRTASMHQPYVVHQQR